MVGPLLVFDLDGTLVDSAPDLLATLDAVLVQHGYPPLADRNTRTGIGHGARYLIEYGLQQHGIVVDTPELDRMHGDFLAYYEANICVESRLYPGTLPLLDRFIAAGWGLAVCTNKLEGLSRQVLAALEVEDRFVAICGGDTFANRKPHPGHLLNTIKAARAKRKQAVMVGDSRTDLDTARAADVPFVGMSYGYTPVPMAELAPDILLDSFDEMSPDMLLALIVGPARQRRRAASVGPPALDFAPSRTY
jgi:phosphoglycolate phosphatase